MAHLRVWKRAFAALAAALCAASSAALAQPVLSGRAQATPQVQLNLNAVRQRPPGARAATQQELQTVSPGLVATIQTATIAPWAVAAAASASMQGWTPITNGPALGGASVVRMSNDQADIIVRAGQNKLYIASFSPSSVSGPLGGSAWRQTNVSVTSDPDCEIRPSRTNYACTFLGEGGAAFIAWIDPTYSKVTPLGGHNGGARPALAPFPESFVVPANDPNYSNGVPLYFERATMFAWDGSIQTWRRRWLAYIPSTLGGSPPGFTEALPAEEQGWKLTVSPTLTPMSCAVVGNAMNCLVGSSNGVRMFDLYELNTASGAVLSQALSAGIGTSTPVELVGTGSGAAIAVVRGNNGHIYQARRSGAGGFGAWRDEGGAAKAGSNISCIATNEQPMCFIQGPDGRIYFKRLATESGL